MFKHRGHFLNANLDDKSGGNLEERINELYQSMYDILGKELKRVEIEKIEEILSSRDFANTARMEALLDLFELSKSKNKVETECLKLICGLKGTISKIFVEETFEEDFAKLSMSFRESNYEEKILQVEDNV